MKSSSKALLGLAALLLLAVVAVVLLRAPNVPNQTQIVQQMEAARAAGERHDINGVLAVVSPQYHDSNVPSPVQLRFLLNRMQGNGPISVTQTRPRRRCPRRHRHHHQSPANCLRRGPCLV